MPPDPLATALAQVLEPIVRRAVADALADQQPSEPLPALLTVDQLCTQLGVSRTTLHRLRAEGLPCIMIGDSPRGSLPDVLAWLKARGTADGGGA
jgi:excisionase family DNA binding protein